MSMYTLLRNQPEPTIEDIEDNFQGMSLEAQPRRTSGKWVSMEVRAGPEGKPGMGSEFKVLPSGGGGQAPVWWLRSAGRAALSSSEEPLDALGTPWVSHLSFYLPQVSPCPHPVQGVGTVGGLTQGIIWETPQRLVT